MCWKVNVVNVANPRYHTPPVPLGFLKHQPCSCSSSSEMICKRSKQVGIRPIIIKPEYKELIVAWFFLGRYLKYDFKASLEKKNMGFQKKNTRFSQAIKVEASFSTPRNSQPSLLVNGWPFGKVSMMCFGRKAVIPLPHLKYTYLDIYIYIYIPVQ